MSAHKSLKKSLTLSACALALGLTACFGGTHLREETAQRIAAPVWMNKREIAAEPFVLTTFERMHERFKPATIYIEGDGLNWISPSRRSLDPTPKNPTALSLAATDKSSNVAYMARPCQYSKLTNTEEACNWEYWTGKRYSPEVVDSMNAALDEIVRRYDIEGVNLVGFSGGGAIAAILASKRSDVLSLRTVAGNLDHKTHSLYHEVTPLNGSLNAIDYADTLKHIPQRHFIGGQDEIVPPAILHSYLQALGNTNCAQYTMIQEAEHNKGWVDKWPSLLKEPITCDGPTVDYKMEMETFTPTTIPRYMPSKP